MELERLTHPIGMSEFAPVFTQGFTTAHWGLEPFPPNLVAVNISENEFLALDPSSNYSAYTVPYKCNDKPAKWYQILNWTTYGPYIVFEDSETPAPYGVYRNITSATRRCGSGEECVDDGCIILVDGFGSTTIGSASIVGLTHGITTIIIFLATVIAAWRVWRESCPEGGVNEQDLKNKYRSPLPRFPWQPGVPNDPNWAPAPEVILEDYEMGPLPQQTEFAGEIHRVRGMLNELFRLDTAIEGMKHAVDGEEGIRDNAMQQANSLLIEIQRLVRPWPGMMETMGVDWPHEQRQKAQEIVDTVFSMRSPRY
jgi:hypothetical protein